MRKLMGRKYELSDPVEWKLNHNKRIVFYLIEAADTVQTPDGPMISAKLTHKGELANPDTDVAALVGHAILYRRSGVKDPQSPELWYWNEKFWIKARSNEGAPYYNNKCYLLYEVKVKDEEELVNQIVTGFEN